ncbi:MAG: hypothetical protein WCK68_09355 [Betaproteobacteria bacterium]|jgi:hypothetical protein
MNKLSILVISLILLNVSPSSFAVEVETDIEVFRSKASLDTVAKILNYTEGLDESGSDSSFWYPLNAKECVYRKGSMVEVKVDQSIDSKKDNEDIISTANAQTPKTEIIFDANIREIKLNNWTPSTVRVGYVQHAGTWWGPNNYFIQIMANGIPMMESSKPRDIDRTQAAWNLVFNRFCPGRKNNF